MKKILSNHKNDGSLSSTLGHFEIAEANLVKLERLYKEIISLIPGGISFGTDITHEEKCRFYEHVLSVLPAIDGWKPTSIPMSLNDIAQSRMDAYDLGEPEAILSIENEIEKPGVELRQYRFLFDHKRKQLIYDSLLELIDLIEEAIYTIGQKLKDENNESHSMKGEEWEKLQNYVNQIDVLLGSSIKRPERWVDINRHLRFAMLHDFRDIQNFDWPTIKDYLIKNIFKENDPIPSNIKDLSELVEQKPRGSVTRELKWEKLSDNQFERLIFSLVNSEIGYQNPNWLTSTDAPDRGRDLSVERVVNDALGGVIRLRVIIQCKHWLNKSISTSVVTNLIGQMKLWEPPRVDVYIIATTGRFTSDAVELIEKLNQSDTALRIEMWPESHLEMLLASRPAFIAEFGLR